jgi:ATP-binding cassette subfamily B (MDR/TAP) protein 1
MAAILEGEEEKPKEIEQVGYFQLFRFATRTDYILMVLGTICACAMGTALPSFALLWGNMTNSFSDSNKMVDSSREVMYQFIYIGLGALVAGWGMFASWMITGERQGIACRKEYLRSLLRQEIGWFDTINQSELSTKFATDSFAFQEAIGEKVSTLIMTIAMFIAGFVIAFIKGWLMTLVTLASLPAIGLGGYLYSTAIAKK